MTSLEKTLKHISRVNELLGECSIELIKRGVRHDASKLTDIELKPLEEMDTIIEQEGQAPFGSDEYERRRKLLKPMLDNHYANNSHHPEHYKNGINGMDLYDVLEMVCDWKAASERGEESSLNLQIAFARFNVEPQLQDVIKNHCERKGWRING